MCGRVIRAHEDKELGYVLDYGSNIERHGPIDATLPPKPKKRKEDAPKKYCGLCNTANILSAKKCSNCEAEFLIENEDGKYAMRSKADILKAKSSDERFHQVTDVIFELAHSKSNGTPMVKCRYIENFTEAHQEYLFLDHPGNIANKSKAFLRSMFKNEKDFYLLGSDGHTVENALILLHNSPEYFKTVDSIVTERITGEKYKRLKQVNYL
jgi:DNA repair protein RadD